MGMWKSSIITHVIVFALFVCQVGFAAQTTVRFDLNTSQSGVAAQFDVRPLIAGVGFGFPALSNATPHLVDFGLLGSGATRFVVYSSSNSPLSTSGVVSAVMTVSSPSSFADGIFVVENVRVSGTNGVLVSGPIPNAQPLVVSTTPASYRAVPVGIPTPLSVEAFDPDGVVSSVAFRLNGISQDLDTVRPFSFAWNPSPSGIHNFDSIVTGGGGRTINSPVVPLRAYEPSEINSYSQFAGIHFGPNSGNPAIAGESADPFGTGLGNLLAYFFGMNPEKPDFALLPFLSRDPSGNFIFRFRRSTFATGVDYSVMNTSNLQTIAWSVFTGGPVNETPITNGVVEVAVTISNSVAAQKFFKLRVQNSAP